MIVIIVIIVIEVVFEMESHDDPMTMNDDAL